MQDWAKEFYHSAAWLACRRAYISRRVAIDGGLCEHCRSCPGKIVHHKTYLTPENISDPNVSLNHSNLAFVCQDCHNDEHLREKFSPRYRFDAFGGILPPI